MDIERELLKLKNQEEKLNAEKAKLKKLKQSISQAKRRERDTALFTLGALMHAGLKGKGETWLPMVQKLVDRYGSEILNDGRLKALVNILAEDDLRIDVTNIEDTSNVQ